MSKQARMRRLRRFIRAYQMNGDCKARCACFATLENTDLANDLWRGFMRAEMGPNYYN